MLALVRRLAKTGGERGITLLEVMVVLAVISILAGVLSPMVFSYLEDSKKATADMDVKAIAATILRLTRDVAHFPLYKDGTRTTGDPDIELLRGPGNDPVDHATAKWLTSSKIGELEDHLVKNNPGGTKYASDGGFAWRGPYLEKVTADSWGNRYLVNIKNANPADTPAKVVWALSAGANGIIETALNALGDSGPAPGGDDHVLRIK